MCGLGEAIANKAYENGYDSGFDSGKMIQLVELVKDGVLAIEVAAEKAGMSVEEFQKMLEI